MNAPGKPSTPAGLVAALVLCASTACGGSARKVQTIESTARTFTRASTSTATAVTPAPPREADAGPVPVCSPDAIKTDAGYGEDIDQATGEAVRCRIDSDAVATDSATSSSTSTEGETSTATATATATSQSAVSTGTAASQNPVSSTPQTSTQTSDRWVDPNDPSKSYRYCTSDASDADATGVKDGWGWEYDPAVGVETSCKVRP